MYDELTPLDIQKMQEEIDYRTLELRPKLIADVQEARAFGDLSENFEYKEAKRQKNRNDSRIRYLQRMIRTAKVVQPEKDGAGIGLFDHIRLADEDGDEMEVQMVTTLRVDAEEGRISRQSPLGRALFGRRAGETVRVEVRPDYSYEVKILSVEKGQENNDIPIAQY